MKLLRERILGKFISRGKKEKKRGNGKLKKEKMENKFAITHGGLRARLDALPNLCCPHISILPDRDNSLHFTDQQTEAQNC